MRCMGIKVNDQRQPQFLKFKNSSESVVRFDIEKC